LLRKDLQEQQTIRQKNQKKKKKKKPQELRASGRIDLIGKELTNMVGEGEI
jgi:hypothetical protein